jgi:ABC-type branched-subunit amino acid transport system ATPase component
MMLVRLTDLSNRCSGVKIFVDDFPGHDRSRPAAEDPHAHPRRWRRRRLKALPPVWLVEKGGPSDCFPASPTHAGTMKWLHYVEIENFKRYGETQRIELDHPAVLIGPNNCGKTSVLQAIALWSIGLRTWRVESEDSKAVKRMGKALNRLSILSVPVPKTRHFWHNLKTGGKDLRITVAVDVKGQPVPVTMIFTHHASDELVYCKPAPEALADEATFLMAASLDVSLLYPMSGISADEAVILPKRIDFLMGRGSTAEVLRNICLQVLEKTPSDWSEISTLMQRLFHVKLGKPQENEKGGVDLAYVQDGTSGTMDLGLSGRGFQQMLLIFSHLYLHKGSVLLIDEPDAHLEILRQQQLYVLLRDMAHRNGCQVVMVTHSEVVLREALDTNLTLILDGQVESLATKTRITHALKHFGAEHYVRARETGHVLYVEGSTDVDMLRAFAQKLQHPVRAALDDGARLNVYYLQDNFPGAERDSHEELARVEGGYGMTATGHFQALRGMIPELRGLVIRDSDGKSPRDSTQGALEILVWKRYEPENYFITPELLWAWVDKHMPESLFALSSPRLLDQLVLEQVFDDNAEDFANYQKLDASTRRTLWRAQTQNKKLSHFGEEFFRRLAQETGFGMLARKGDLHELISLCDTGELNGEVREKLDAMHRLLTR